MLRIDAHQHLWHFDPAEFDWLDGDLATLRRDFLLADLQAATQGAGVAGTVAVQARQSTQETDWLLQLATEVPLVKGVVGWLPLRSPDFGAQLERYRAHRALKGLRHVVQAEAAGFLDDAAFNAGIAALQGTGLVYDILIYERHLQETIRFVDRHPQQQFVLDHLAKPRIRAAEMQPWAEGIRELAHRPHVACKVSGMVTEADPTTWTSEHLLPYFAVALEAFSPARLMVGSDWPVLLARVSYQRWWDTVSAWVASLSESEQAEILGRTAVRIYRLETSGQQAE